jgi:hypothetical protein
MRRTACALVAMVALVGCSPQTAPPGGSGSSAFPADTLQDWVTYGDYLIELTATSEKTLDPEPDELREGEGLFRREFSLSVDGVAWARPDAKHPPPTTLTWTSGGWQFKNGNLDRRTRIDDPNQLQTQLSLPRVLHRCVEPQRGERPLVVHPGSRGRRHDLTPDAGQWVRRGRGLRRDRRKDPTGGRSAAVGDIARPGSGPLPGPGRHRPVPGRRCGPGGLSNPEVRA